MEDLWLVSYARSSWSWFRGPWIRTLRLTRASDGLAIEVRVTSQDGLFMALADTVDGPSVGIAATERAAIVEALTSLEAAERFAEYADIRRSLRTSAAPWLEGDA
jgi:hypothetical protein